MRVLSAVFVAASLLLGAGAGQALSISPNPVNQVRLDQNSQVTLDADVFLISISGDTMTLQVSVTTGSLTGLDVSMLFDDLGLPSLFSFVTGASTVPGTGDEAANALAVPTEAAFLFPSWVDAGETSDYLVIQFDAPIQLGWEGGFTFDTGLAIDSFYTIVPEPGVALLLAGGLSLLARTRRRR
jgi:hypothetical protein